ncbi:hypothetical protein ACLBWP_03500 [Microbacterium sp. M1A1_1b]
MNPDPVAVEAYLAGYRRAESDLRRKQTQSRAAQPKRKDNRKGHRR